MRDVANPIPSAEPPEAWTCGDSVDEAACRRDVPDRLGDESLGQGYAAVWLAPDSAPALVDQEGADIHEFENPDKLPLLGGKQADFFFKGWKEVSLYVYIQDGKIAHYSSFV